MTRRIQIFALLILFLSSSAAFAQEKRSLQHEDVNEWKSLTQARMANNGEWVAWREAPARGDSRLFVSSADGSTQHIVPRGDAARFSGDSRYLLFKIVPQADSVRQKKLDKVKSDDMPSDSLGIMSLRDGSIRTFADVQSFKVSDEGGHMAAFRLTERASEEETPADTTATEEPEEEEASEEEESTEEEEDDTPDKKKGTSLIVLNLESGSTNTFKNVTEYVVDKQGKGVTFLRESEEGEDDGVYAAAGSSLEERTAASGVGNYVKLALSDDGETLAFMTNRDDFDADQPSFTLFAGNLETLSAVASEGSEFLAAGWWVSENATLDFSDSGQRLYFGTAPKPEPEPDDEGVLEEDKVKVDVWNWKDPLLQPMQLLQANRERDRSYRAVAHLDTGKNVQLASVDVPTVSTSMKGDGDVILGTTNMKYRQEISWESPGFQDAWIINAQTGERMQILEAIQDFPRFSPDGNFVTYWDRYDEVYKVVDTATGANTAISSGSEHSLVNELDDRSYAPGSYGQAGWTDGDAEFVFYDKYDVLAATPDGTVRNVTEGAGREAGVRLRVRDLDFDEPALPAREEWLLSALDLETMDAGFWEVDPRRGDAEKIVMSPHQYRIFTKAEDADALLFAVADFRTYPDLHTTDLDFNNPVRLSDTNPQQDEFIWGTAELVRWTSIDGDELKGILYKPDGFDASKKYPLMVYFYEKNSTNLHSHRAPSAGGSSINYSFYVSRGYLLFVPDIPYKNGYPGESAMNAVMPGITSLVDQGFVDRDRIGVQGHSWGGYQISYMVTQTNLFAAAEAGAPVSNMTSAYGGIRWGSGMSRAFQYERTQSRIGGTLWNAQQRYMHNSPLFQADKIRTPLLMMHNDEDGAVPWYQGIEFFSALRRLGQPVWMLNYNGAGHGLSDLDDRRDWQIRMQQFFDHYLMDAPAPVWLAKGVPAVDKGRTMGLELMDH